jgi:hypothetical protein
MNKEIEFRRLRWLIQVQELIQSEKQLLMVERLSQLNNDETALEFNDNELARLLEIEKLITKLSHTYDFTDEPSRKDIVVYLTNMLGVPGQRGFQW